MNRIQRVFNKRTKKLIPYLTAGYPSKEDTVNMVLEAEKAGASMVEIGMPFSDPLADGPIIQNSSQVAIKNGVTISWILKTVSIIRSKTEIPIALMGYINPIISFGLDIFINECKNVGVDGLIIPDLPLEESYEYINLTHNKGISPILLVAPNSNDKRIKIISSMAKDLIYCVSTLGITGNSSVDLKELESYLLRVEKNSSCPYIVGFGIKNKLDVEEINKIAHGAVIGSAIISEIKNKEKPVEYMKKYLEKLLT